MLLDTWFPPTGAPSLPDRMHLQISPPDLACLDCILAYVKIFCLVTWPRATNSSHAIAFIHGCNLGCRNSCDSAFLVSAGVLREYGLLPGRLRPVGGNGFRLALCPNGQPVQA
jgi:hypothetical protein